MTHFWKAHSIFNTEKQYKATQNLEQSSKSVLRHMYDSHLIKS